MTVWPNYLMDYHMFGSKVLVEVSAVKELKFNSVNHFSCLIGQIVGTVVMRTVQRC